MASIPFATWFAPNNVRAARRRWAARAGRPPRRHFARPRLEALEDRTAPATLVVSPGGVVPQSFSSIQAAVTAAASGDTVLVDPGTYQEQVTIGKNLTLQGNGAGANIFQYDSLADSTVSASGRDTIEDFNAAQGDKIDLRLIDANAKLAGDQAFTFIGTKAFDGHHAGELDYAISGGDTFIYGETNGGKLAGFSIELLGAHGLTAADFKL